MELYKNQKINGSLDLSGTQISSLPEGLHVGGSLYLQGTQISSLPEGLHVGGYLDLQGTQITSLPEGLHVGGYLDLSGTPLGLKRIVNNCGEKMREICAWNDSIDGLVISIGCFRGPKEKAIAAIREKYKGNSADEYCAKVEEAFQKIQS